MTDVANADAPTLPLFYTNPIPVSAQRHGDWKVNNNRGFAYASQVHAVPVLAEEIPQLQAVYPIVFSGGETPGAMALLGLRAGQNLFVDKDGKWRQGAPVPAYILRYPFLLVELPEDKRLVLIMEEDANLVGPNYEVPLFKDGQGTKEGEEILNYCVTFNNSARLTQAFCNELAQHDLLVEQRADVVTPDGKRLTLSGFRVIDEQKFNALPDEVFLEWRKRNWIGLVYAHFVSLGRWQSLIDLLKDQPDTAA